MQFIISNNRTPADIGLSDPHAADTWAHYIAGQLDLIKEMRNAVEGEAKQFGERPGSTGHGYTEGYMPAKLWKALEARDPDLLDNDKKWEQLKRTFPNMFLPVPKKAF